MTVEKTYVIKGKPESQWILVDANDQGIGRLATQIANYLLGKHKPTYTPGVDMGDFVVVVNASKLRIGTKRFADKSYNWHSGYPGGLTTVTLRDLMSRYPDRVIRRAVWGMLPHNKMGRKLIKRLKIYGGSEHPHQAQNPQPVS
ncbi:MAG: 50S ribosomal protein L13 [Chloroflexi bacterium]|jgi:large subunit ribosomal protein L13|nr:50S ribosomal protein L13 [Anaerolineaceae bacterium]NMB87827.1 50S ribosomal protein L13 [Chloroflexota bacterium]